MRVLAVIALFTLFPFSQTMAQGFYEGEPQELPKEAEEKELPYVVELNASWCGFCKLFERKTLKDEKVISYLEQNYLMATMDSEEGYGMELSEKYKIKALPALLFFASDGKLLGKMTGYQDSEYFLNNLQKYKKKFDKKYGD